MVDTIFSTPILFRAASWTIIMDFLFFVGASALVAWYYFFYLRKDLLGGFWGAMLVACVGALIVFALLQNVIRDVIMWLMSPKIGSTQLSHVNLIAIFLGAFFALYIMNRINHNRERGR